MLYKLATSKFLGNIIFVLILAGVCLFIFESSKRINYPWRWYRVPGYIVAQVSDEFRARTSGVVQKVDGGIFIIKADGTRELVAETGRLSVAEGSEVMVGDLVAAHKGIMLGPLTKGLIMTLKISFFSIIFAIILGVITGMMRISPIYVFKKLAVTYVEIVRGTPLLVQIFILYFFFGKIFNLDQIVAGIAALSIFTGAYIAEIVRAGVQSVSRGQTEAARSLGLSYTQNMRYVVLPQALRRTLPPMAGQFISLIKDSSLVSVIAITDLTKAGREVISSSFSTFEVWFTVAFMYLVVTAALSYIINHFELRLSRSD